jgi:hypothetical protein
MLRMAESLRMEPVVISQLVRVAICSFAMRSLESCLNQGTLPEPEARELMRLYGEAEDSDAMIRAFIGVRCAERALLLAETKGADLLLPLKV